MLLSAETLHLKSLSLTLKLFPNHFSNSKVHWYACGADEAYGVCLVSYLCGAIFKILWKHVTRSLKTCQPNEFPTLKFTKIDALLSLKHLQIQVFSTHKLFPSCFCTVSVMFSKYMLSRPSTTCQCKDFWTQKFVQSTCNDFQLICKQK